MTEKNTAEYCQIEPFKIDISYVEIDSVSHLNINDSHVHDECEIYINISGDVSFVVDGTLYAIAPGDIIITRPGEVHRCIYRSNAIHKHFWILLSSVGNEQLLDFFFSRPGGHGNLLKPSPENSRRINLICNNLLNSDLTEIEKYRYFFDLMFLLRVSAGELPHYENTSMEMYFPEDVSFVLDFLRDNYASEITVAELAEKAHVSINTLERHFKEAFDTTPTEYIRKKRLIHAQNLLRQGYSVQEVSELSGFSDYSYFIAVFKKTFGITPLRYKKQFI